MDPRTDKNTEAEIRDDELANRVRLSSLNELIEETQRLIGGCKQKLQLYTRNLDPRILNNREIEQMISRFVRSSRYASVEILITDETNLQGIDHRLVSLSQNFASFVQIRVIPKDYHENYFGFYLLDGRTIIYRNNVERFECEIHSLPSSLVKQKAKYFDEVWQLSIPASHLRALHL